MLSDRMPPAVSFTLNGRPADFTGDPEMPLLWHLREDRALVGTKYGCGIGACGACTVHVDGAARRSCVVPMSSMGGRAVTTIEGLAADGALHPVQEAWIQEDVAQCGYCQAGQVMAASALLARTPRPTEADLHAAITNLCRCGSYVRVRSAIARAVSLMQRTEGAGDAEQERAGADS